MKIMRALARVSLCWMYLLWCTSDGASPAVDYLAGLRLSVAETLDNMRSITHAATTAARRVCNGGRLYVVADEQGFAIELLNRAGGLAIVELLPNSLDTVTPRDVVLVGSLGLDPSKLTSLVNDVRKRGGLTIGCGLFGDILSQQTDLYLEVAAKHRCISTALLERKLGDVRPLGGPAQIVTAWTFIAELIAACTRVGKVPAILHSVGAPGARERNATLRGNPFVEVARVARVPEGRLGREFLREIERDLKGIAKTQLPKCQRAAELAAQAIS